MIFLKISGRGGNQFFQYAFVQKYIDENYPNEVMNISFEYLEEKKTDSITFVNVLSDFNIKKVNIINKVNYSFKQKIIDLIYRITLKMIRINAKLQKRKLQKKDYVFLTKLLQKTMNKNGLYYYIPEMQPFYKSKTNNLIFFGSYENSKVMKENEEHIKKYYTSEQKLNENAKVIYEKAISTNSVCVTVRRGDFLSNKYKQDFYICDEEYFKKSIDKMNKLINTPQYIVFSDDIDWCKNNLDFPENTIYENKGNSIAEKIKIMSACKNFIISNSTFSWWVQFLSNSCDKKVIAPKIWNNFEYCEPIYMDNWYLI